jgi:tetratricopeptide (TPR) repeat protein
MSKLLDTVILGALLIGVPLTAFAESYPECVSEPSDEEVEAAKGAFMAGKAAFDEADYERAITYWSDAYRRDCTAHDLLRNLARAYELSGQKQAAIDALQTYLERVPETPKRDQFQRRIEKLQNQLDEEAAATSEPVSPPADTPSDAPPAASPVAPTTSAPPPRGKKPLAPLVVMGAGGVIAVVGAVGFLSEAGKSSDFEEQCGSARDGCPSDEVQQDAMDWRQRQTIFGVTTWAGVGVAATGLVWYLAAPRREVPQDGHRMTLQPVVARSGAGLHLRGRF